MEKEVGRTRRSLDELLDFLIDTKIHLPLLNTAVGIVLGVLEQKLHYYFPAVPDAMNDTACGNIYWAGLISILTACNYYFTKRELNKIKRGADIVMNTLYLAIVQDAFYWFSLGQPPSLDWQQARFSWGEYTAPKIWGIPSAYAFILGAYSVYAYYDINKKRLIQGIKKFFTKKSA